VHKQAVVICFVPSAVDPLITEELARLEIEPTAIIPWDEELREYDIKQKPLLDLPDNSKAVMAVNRLMAKILN
jgi:CO dehydrogenase maturation factor